MTQSHHNSNRSRIDCIYLQFLLQNKEHIYCDKNLHLLPFHLHVLFCYIKTQGKCKRVLFLPLAIYTDGVEIVRKPWGDSVEERWQLLLINSSKQKVSSLLRQESLNVSSINKHSFFSSSFIHLIHASKGHIYL